VNFFFYEHVHQEMDTNIGKIKNNVFVYVIEKKVQKIMANEQL